MKIRFSLLGLGAIVGLIGIGGKASAGTISTLDFVDPSCTPAGVCTNDWIVAPVAFTGAPVIKAGVTTITSSWTGGTYIDRNGLRQTANVTLDSSFSFAGQLLTLTWKLTNNGSGDFFQFFQAGPGQGPRFLFPPVPLSAGMSQTDSVACVCQVVQGTWGGAWNSGVGAADSQAGEFQLTPEPAALSIVGLGLSLLALAKLRFCTPSTGRGRV